MRSPLRLSTKRQQPRHTWRTLQRTLQGTKVNVILVDTFLQRESDVTGMVAARFSKIFKARLRFSSLSNPPDATETSAPQDPSSARNRPSPSISNPPVVSEASTNTPHHQAGRSKM